MAGQSQLEPLLTRSGLVRTELDCHGCTEQGITPNRFIATVDYSLNGNHEIECPRCGHIHYRVIKDGKVTSERHNSGYPTHKVARRNVWKADSLPIVSSTASAFLRDLWLEKGMVRSRE